MPTLTERERSVARLTAGGESALAIAAKLSISVRSVENHLYAICAKFGVTSTAELIVLVARERT